MMKGIATILFGLVLMMFGVALAVFNLVAGDNLFAYLFIACSSLSLVTSVLGLVLVFVCCDKKKKKQDSSKEETK